MTHVKVLILVLLASAIACEELRLAPMPPPRAFLNFITATGLASSQASHNGRWCISKITLNLAHGDQCPGVWYTFPDNYYTQEKCCAADKDLDAKSIQYHKKHPEWYWHERGY